MNYLPWAQYHNVRHILVTILLVQRNGRERREETVRSNTHQPHKEQRRQGQPFASGFVLGAIAAAGVVKWLLESQSRKAARLEQDVFSWPAIVKTERR